MYNHWVKHVKKIHLNARKTVWKTRVFPFLITYQLHTDMIPALYSFYVKIVSLSPCLRTKK